MSVLKDEEYVELYNDLAAVLYNERLQHNSEWVDQDGNQTELGKDGFVDCANEIEAILECFNLKA
tara:strand:- start:203 stop:397 length:195 start_codon:yes stop_codon:yes gene_type:complete